MFFWRLLLFHSILDKQNERKKEIILITKRSVDSLCYAILSIYSILTYFILFISFLLFIIGLVFFFFSFCCFPYLVIIHIQYSLLFNTLFFHSFTCRFVIFFFIHSVSHFFVDKYFSFVIFVASFFSKLFSVVFYYFFFLCFLNVTFDCTSFCMSDQSTHCN